MITYQEEYYSDIATELKALAEAHYAEVVPFSDKIEFSINETLYDTLGKSGNIIIVTARDDNALIGYCSFFLGMHHYANAKIATLDTIYVKDDYRHKDVASSMLIQAEVILELENVTTVSLALKKKTSLPESLGYILDEYRYIKYIGDTE